MGVKGTVALLEEKEFAVDGVELYVIFALDFVQRRFLRHQRLEQRLQMVVVGGMGVEGHGVRK